MTERIDTETVHALVTEWRKHSSSFRDPDRSLKNLLHQFESKAFRFLQAQYNLSKGNTAHITYVRGAISQAVKSSGEWPSGHAECAAEELGWHTQSLSAGATDGESCSAVIKPEAAKVRRPFLERFDTKEKRIGLILTTIGLVLFTYGLIELSKSWSPFEDLMEAITNPVDSYAYNRFKASAWGVYLVLAGIALPAASQVTKMVYRWVDKGST